MSRAKVSSEPPFKFVPVIEKDIPLPPKNGHYTRILKGLYPFAQMDVGDSFIIPVVTGTTQNSLSSQACLWASAHAPDRHFAVRSVKEIAPWSNGEVVWVVRCWRIV